MAKSVLGHEQPKTGGLKLIRFTPSTRNGNIRIWFLYLQERSRHHQPAHCQQMQEVTVGDNAQKRVTADVLETDRSNDL